ncbi:peptidase M1 [Saccharomonospora sp. CUA-673]|uniref:M1 family metallopeptidase n=1 Tax=Saccharomonospora sp. CUA-673 TaxID=1904969 RepID=UPI00096359C4|nr:M1 family metallopeptidase [Saccharomonospora sp. CUA-673]OLT40615.1 peptidase M1 [Saccharomonospora sp. CUA-673]
MNASPSPGADVSGDAYLPAHGNGGYRVLRYDLDLEYRPAANRLSGTARITAVATQPLSGLVLDFEPYKLNRVQVQGVNARYTHRGHKLRVKPARSIAEGAEFVVDIRYAGNPAPLNSPEWGDVGWDELTDGALVASQPVGAPSWFPCNDHPSDKAAYRLSMKVPAPYTVVATGRLVDTRRSAGATTWVFERDEPSATYLMSVQIGQYVEVALDDVARIFVPPRLRDNALFDFGRQPQIRRTLEDWFGPYPFDEYAVVVTDDELDDPIEAQGMAVFGAGHVDGLRTHERLVVHEFAHQWFGNSLTVADWKHIWLNEGFATYAEWLWSEAAGGETADELARRWRAEPAQQGVGPRIGDPGVRDMFSQRVYKGGALTLHALRGQLGDETFFALLRDWTSTHRHGTVTTADFTALAAHHAGRPLDTFFTTWLDTDTLPA